MSDPTYDQHVREHVVELEKALCACTDLREWEALLAGTLELEEGTALASVRDLLVTCSHCEKRAKSMGNKWHKMLSPLVR